MYDIEKLIAITADCLEASADFKRYIIDLRKEKGIVPDGTLWIPSLNGSEAYRLGELCECSSRSYRILADICAMLDIDQDLLIPAVKSMQRKERHNGRYDNPVLTCWIARSDKERLCRFLSNELGEYGHSPWYSSTGRKKAWCK